jgi:hypothetical protein
VVAHTRKFSPRLAGALSALFLFGGTFAQWSPVGAQTIPLHTDRARSVPADGGFSIALPTFQTYVDQHGGSRTLGLPLSNDFQLLGRRVQIFERAVLQQRSNGSVLVLDLLSDALPLVHADGATFPTADPDLVAAIPALDSPTYQDQALAAIDSGWLDATAPDDWNDLPVQFGATFRGSVSCTDLPSSPCDQRSLQRDALDVWGLPTSAPTADPNNPDLVYQRFQRGIMQFSQSTGQTEAVPLGAWFKRVLIGANVPDDLAADLMGSRYLAQYSASLPLGVSRATELPATSLASAFSAPATIITAGAGGGLLGDPAATPVLPGMPTFGEPGVAATPTPAVPVVPLPSTPLNGTPVTANGTPTPAASASASPVAGTPGTTNQLAPGVIAPTTPMGPDPCAGDEQMLFAPKKPYVGTDVLIAVTSSAHHDVRSVRLTGPVKTGAVSERPGLNGWVWEWTISPSVDGWYEFTFFSDGARACATSGFNALPAFGPAVSVTATPVFSTATPIPTMTATPTATVVPAPSLATTGPTEPVSGACAGHLLRLNGTAFGATQSALNGNVLFSGPTGAVVATIFNWTNSSILLTVPTGLTAGAYQIVVTTAQGASSPLTYQVGAC